MTYEAINFRKKFALFEEQWQPKVIAEMNAGKLNSFDRTVVEQRRPNRMGQSRHPVHDD